MTSYRNPTQNLWEMPRQQNRYNPAGTSAPRANMQPTAQANPNQHWGFTAPDAARVTEHDKWGDYTPYIGMAQFVQSGNFARILEEMIAGQRMQGQYRDQANAALDPQSRMKAMLAMAQRMRAGARDGAVHEAQALRQAGYGPGASAAAGLAAQNRAAEASNNAMAMNMSPEGDLKAALQGIQINDPATMNSLIQMMNEWYGMQANRDNQINALNAQKPSGLGALAGILGQVAGGWAQGGFR